MARTPASFWDRVAEGYAAKPVKNAAAYEATLERTRSHLSADHLVLELGCGTGTTALLLASSVGRIEATDISQAMIGIGQEKARDQGVGNVVFSQATSSNHSFEQGAFDAVMAFNLLHLVDDLPRTLGEVRRLCRPGGVFISKTPCLAGRGPFIPLLIGALQWAGRAPRVTFLSTADMDRAIRAAGFEIEETGDYPPSPPAHFVVARAI